MDYGSLEHFVEQTITPTNLQALSEKKNEWIKYIHKEKEHILQDINHTVFHTQESILIERSIQQHQHIIGSLANTVLTYSSKIDKPDANITDFYTEICSVLESILSYILKYYSKYFDLDQPIPPSYKSIAVKEIQLTLEQVEKALQGTEIHQTLLNISLKPIHQFLHNQENITYRKLDYFKELIHQLLLLSKNEEVNYMVFNYQLHSNLPQEITNNEHQINIKTNVLLLYMNFNSPDYIAYCITGIQSKYSELSYHEKLHILHQYKKLITLVRLKPGYTLMPELKETASEQIGFCITQEIEFIQNTQTVSPMNITTNNNNLGKTAKIHANLSVAELALMIKTSIEAGIIHQVPTIEMLRTVIEAYQTEGTEKISLNSIRNYYFNPKKSAATKIIKKLLDWIKVVRQYE